MIPYGRQDISQQDIDAVIEVLNSDYLTQGPVVPKFESAVATRVNANFAVASNSATSSLHSAVWALGLEAGDLFWTTPITFVATANCARYLGAEVDFVDIDPATFNMCPEALERKLVAAEKVGRLPKVIAPVHMCGQSPDMANISKLARRFDVKVLEDASHAIGAEYKNNAVGDCSHSDITVFSFHPVKIVTSAEGGMAVTNSEKLASKMQLFRSHGITRDEKIMQGESEGPWYYQQLALGFNYRMTELQAALGLSQLKRLDKFVLRRNELARRYDAMFSELPVTVQKLQADCYSSYHLYVLQLSCESLAKRLSFFKNLRAKGIGANVHYIPVHLQPYYQNLGFRSGDFPYSEDYYSRAISIPLFPGLSFSEQDYIVETISRELPQ
ncbi:UDP-4-amino-4,6-dideoxy-N-acetyl-beta-L-altrosamine transaminase [Roseibium sp. SCP14]|uniref:UDP-4-amino-4, 6-dideoxy-N-acetyl-beta-L-altrosamine transaminase n=1 Tax=Roseibium sp. SCP14 TaxID=3141375 RepID=UPI00333BDD96